MENVAITLEDEDMSLSNYTVKVVQTGYINFFPYVKFSLIMEF